MNRRLNTPGNFGAGEGGFASLVFVVLVSLAITATSVGVVHTIKKTQQLNVASNAVTHSQNGAWVGVEAFGHYIATLDLNGLENLDNDYTFLPEDTAASLVGQLSARNVTSLTLLPDGSSVITAQIVNVHNSAKSSAVIEAVYSVAMSNPDQVDTRTLNFDGDVELTGGLSLLLDTGGLVDLVVSGKVDLDDVADNTLNSVTAGGPVSIGSSAVVNYIYSNDNVLLEGSAKALEVHTLGTFISKAGGGGAAKVWANGNVDILQQKVRGEEINSVVNISVGQGGPDGYGVLTAGGTLSIDGLGAGSKIDAGYAVGNIDIPGAGVVIDEVISESDITCPGLWWDKTITLQANGSVHNCSPSHPGIYAGAANDVVPMTPLDPFPYVDVDIDVWKLKQHANYHVEYDSALSNIKVTVNNVAGITDGSVFYIGTYIEGWSTPYKDYLCTSVDSSGNCSALPTLPICYGTNIWGGCVSYIPGTDTFKFRPGNMVPGIFFIEGNVELSNGHAQSTILATGNINTDSFGISAPNDGSYSRICDANSDHFKPWNSNKARYQPTFSTHYPTNLCDKAAGVYTPIPTANIALAAGGIDPDGYGAYVGGDIDLNASNDVTGSVLAGNILTTGGDTTVHGIISAAGDGAPNTDMGEHQNTLEGSTTVNLTTTPGSTFTPTVIPNMGSGNATVTVTFQGARNL